MEDMKHVKKKENEHQCSSDDPVACSTAKQKNEVTNLVGQFPPTS